VIIIIAMMLRMMIIVLMARSHDVDGIRRLVDDAEHCFSSHLALSTVCTRLLLGCWMDDAGFQTYLRMVHCTSKHFLEKVQYCL
jgi:succinate dehydrogenase hydrophobic anchor subunit